jgi:hypothetical protein
MNSDLVFSAKGCGEPPGADAPTWEAEFQQSALGLGWDSGL